MRRLHLFLAVGLGLTIFGGFWPGYFGPLTRGDTGAARPTVVHVHAAIFAVWVLLYVTQASLVVAGRVRVHRSLGVAAAIHGALVFLMGLVVSVAAPVARVHMGQLKPDVASLVSLYNLTDVLLFGGFLAAALVRRSDLDLHRRLMLSATVALAGAGVGRMIRGESPWYLVAWIWPLLALIVFEAWTRRRVHVVSLLSVALFALASFKVPIYGSSPMWRRLGGLLTGPFL